MDMLANSNIRNKTDTIGFLVITIKIPDRVDMVMMIYKNITLKLFNKLNVSKSKYIEYKGGSPFFCLI